MGVLKKIIQDISREAKTSHGKEEENEIKIKIVQKNSESKEDYDHLPDSYDTSRNHLYLDSLLQNPEYLKIKQIQLRMLSYHTVGMVSLRKGITLSWGLELRRGDKAMLLSQDCIMEIPEPQRQSIEFFPDNSWIYVKEFIISIPNEYLRLKSVENVCNEPQFLLQ